MLISVSNVNCKLWKDPILALALTSDDKYYLTGAVDNSIKIWDFEQRSLLVTLHHAHIGMVLGHY